MSALGMNYTYDRPDKSGRIKGVIIVVAVHALIGYALISGMARTGLNFIKKPLEAVVIQEVIIPPPPPPPPPKPIEQPKNMPKVEAPPPFVPPPDVAPPVQSTAPVIQATTVAPVAPVVIAPPPPPPPPVAAPKVNRQDIKVACPTQVAPEMPRRALDDGVQGVVKASALIVNGVVKEVTILSGPRVFHSAVRTAMMQYRCVNDGEITATQEFSFRVE